MDLLKKIFGHIEEEKTALLPTKARTVFQREKEIDNLAYQLKHRIVIEEITTDIPLKVTPVSSEEGHTYARYFPDGVEVVTTIRDPEYFTGEKPFTAELYANNSKRKTTFQYWIHDFFTHDERLDINRDEEIPFGAEESDSGFGNRTGPED